MRRLAWIAVLAALTIGSRCMADEDPIWKATAPIDVHAHLGTFAGYDLSLSTLLDNVERHGIRLALVSNIDGAELPGTTGDLAEGPANEATRDAVARHPKLRGLAWARPGAKGSTPENLKPFLLKGFVGVKLHPEMNHFAADAPVVDGYLALCERYRVPAVVHCQAAEPIARLARRHAKVPVVLYHSGFFTDHEEAVRVVEQAAKQGDADLYLETAQVEPDQVLSMVRRVGARRVLFGTDATYYGKAHYRRYTAMLALLAARLSPADFRLVMSGNAERLFRLDGGR